jgi:very-short-patch-repair endonuclease
MSKIPQALSVGEETLALHLQANKLSFEREVCLFPARKWKVDFFLRQFNLVVEVEGGTWKIGRHQRPAAFAVDCQKYNTLTVLGYSLLRYTTEQVERGDAIKDIHYFIANSGASRT